MSVELIRMCWLILRTNFRCFAEGVFIYSLIATSIGQNGCLRFKLINKKDLFLFSSIYSLAIMIPIVFSSDEAFYRLISIGLVFVCFWREQRKHKLNHYDFSKGIQHFLTVAVILVLAVESCNLISWMLLHTYCVSTGIYNIINSNWVLRDLYKSAIMILDVFLIFLVYKLRFINMKDIKAMSIHKWVLMSFSLCFVSIGYVKYSYVLFSNTSYLVQHRNIFLWTLAFVLPTYIGFYLVVKQLTKLLNLNANATAYENILIWICNPSIIKTTHLDIYDSDVFMANFESKKLVLKQKLKKLGIDNKFKGYSGLILCLFLTRLFMGLKGWNFETDVFWQTSLVIDVGASKLRKDIENIIDQVWNTSEVETLIDGYYLPYHNINIYDQTRRPTVEQFLTDVAKSI